MTGRRMAVCDTTFHILTHPAGPHAGQIVAVAPREELLLEQAEAFDRTRPATGHPRETKGQDYNTTRTTSSDYCGPDS